MDEEEERVDNVIICQDGAKMQAFPLMASETVGIWGFLGFWAKTLGEFAKGFFHNPKVSKFVKVSSSQLLGRSATRTQGAKIASRLRSDHGDACPGHFFAGGSSTNRLDLVLPRFMHTNEKISVCCLKSFGSS